MIVILERRFDVKSWLKDTPLKDLTPYDIASFRASKTLVELADSVILMDHELDNPVFRIMKTRVPNINEGIYPMHRLEEFMVPMTSYYNPLPISLEDTDGDI